MAIGRKIASTLGVILLITGLLGPLTYADDFRHTGELATAIGLVLSGLCLLVPSLPLQWRCSASFHAAAPFVLLGLVAATPMDMSILGLLLGAFAGAAAIWLRCSRRGRVAAAQSLHVKAGSLRCVE